MGCMIVEVMSVSREGGCACGAVRYRLTSDPLFTHCCHCLNCQRQTGSAFVINVLIEADRLELLAGVPQPVDGPRDYGSKQKCGICRQVLSGAAQESNLPSVGLPRLTGFEDLLRKVHLRTEAGFRPRFSPSTCRYVR
jgi:hypothetical protein